MLIKELDLARTSGISTPNLDGNLCGVCPLSRDLRGCGAIVIKNMIENVNYSYSELISSKNPGIDRVSSKMIGKAVALRVNNRGFSDVVDEASDEIVKCTGATFAYSDTELAQLNAERAKFWDQPVKNYLVTEEKPSLRRIPGYLEAVMQSAASE